MVDERTRQLVAASSKVVLATHVEPAEDMRAERARATFSPDELAAFLNGGQHKQQRKAELVKILGDSDWGDKTNRYFLTRQEEYTGALRGILGIWDLVQQKQVSLDDALLMRQLFNFPGGLELHIGMFIPSLLSQASDEQQATWLPLAQSLQIIGTYAQTELGHGTFVRGLETTATFDLETDEFVVHSPSLSSTKWWPGGLGKTATHVILMARLFAQGKDHGPHAFVVQIRTLDTHLPLPGITVGDIGPKFGYNGVDNGFLIFDHVRIPRKAMLMRYAKVSADGKYSPPPAANSKASYATMVYVRATIVEEAGWVLARAVTIAVRYNAVRRQTAAHAGERELQVLDYQNTAAELLPLLAGSYALIFMGKSAMAMYKRFEADRDRGEFGSLPELHAVLSGLKALSTWITSDGIEACRRGCGGHGYSLLSGLPTLFTSYVQNATWEGDNNVLCLQTARYLLKNLLAVQSGKAAGGSASYLQATQQELKRRCGVHNAEEWLEPEPMRAALRHRATRLAVSALQALHAAGEGTLAFEGAPWNACTVDLIRVAKAHSMLVLYTTFADGVEQLARQDTVSSGAVAALHKLVSLCGLSGLLREAGDFLEDGYLDARQAAGARSTCYALLRALRPDAVALVDAFGFEDYLLNSALGRKDGDVYRDLLRRAQASPLNASPEGPAWAGILKPRLSGPHAKL